MHTITYLKHSVYSYGNHTNSGQATHPAGGTTGLDMDSNNAVV